MTVQVLLPYPPTANNLFLNMRGRGRVKSPQYRTWIGLATVKAYQQKIQKTPGKVRVSYLVARPDKRRRDISNLVKPIEDLLVSVGAIDDDSKIQSFEIAWDETGSFSGVLVKVTEA